MSKIKKIIIFITIICVATAIYGLSNKVNANSTIDENGTIWTYRINEDGNAEINMMSGEIPENVIIPSILDGYKVVKIREF